MKNEIVKVDDQEFDVTLEQAQTLEKAYAPSIVVRMEHEIEYKEILAMGMTTEAYAKARSLRLKLVKVGTGIDAVHKTQKDFVNQFGRLCDAIRRKEKLPVQQMKDGLLAIEKHEERVEEERIAALNLKRADALRSIGAEYLPVGLAQMGDEEWDNCLSVQTLAVKVKKAAAAKEKADNLAKEKRDKAKAKRLKEDNKRLHAEAIEREKKAEKEQLERVAKEQEAQDERDRIAKIAQGKIDKEAKERAAKEAIADIATKKKADEAAKKLEDANAKAKRLEKIASDRADELAAGQLRAADIVHRGTINLNIVQQMVMIADIHETEAKAIVTAMAKGEIDNVSIKY